MPPWWGLWGARLRGWRQARVKQRLTLKSENGLRHCRTRTRINNEKSGDRQKEKEVVLEVVTLDTERKRKGLALCDPMCLWNRATPRGKSRTAVALRPRSRDFSFHRGRGSSILNTRFVGLSSELSFELSFELRPKHTNDKRASYFFEDEDTRCGGRHVTSWRSVFRTQKSG